MIALPTYSKEELEDLVLLSMLTRHVISELYIQMRFILTLIMI